MFFAKRLNFLVELSLTHLFSSQNFNCIILFNAMIFVLLSVLYELQGTFNGSYYVNKLNSLRRI